jgi:hypothetical protein
MANAQLQGMTASPVAFGPLASLASFASSLIVVDGALATTTCRALIEAVDTERWLSTTAEILSAANGPHLAPPQRISEPELPCRLVGADDRPGFAIIDDPLLALRLFHRLGPALPTTREDAELTGLKPLFRCVRYRVGEGTQAHTDPARATHDGQRSQLSVLVFLNDDFCGGAIEFPEIGRTIAARAGRAIVFPHGAVHRDHVVERGRKFVLETEAFFRC